MPISCALGTGLPAPAVAGRALSAEVRPILARWDALSVSATAPRARALDNLLISPLRDAGVLAKLDAFGTPQHAILASRVDLKAPARDLLTLVNSPTIVADRRLQGDGTTSYFEIAFNPATAGGNYSLDSASMGVWSLTDVSTAAFDMGNGNAARLRGRFNGLMGAGANASTFQTTSVADSLGFYGWTRRASTGFDFFKGSTLTPITQASASVPSGNVQLSANLGTNLSARGYGAYFVGGGLTAQNIADFRSILSAWLTYLGAI